MMSEGFPRYHTEMLTHTQTHTHPTACCHSHRVLLKGSLIDYKTMLKNAQVHTSLMKCTCKCIKISSSHIGIIVYSTPALLLTGSLFQIHNERKAL